MQGVNKRGLEPGWPSQGLRVKRAILASRRAGPSTPVPSWKVFNNQLYDGIAAAAAAHAAAGRPTPVSARKLAASLWELQDRPLPACLCSQHWPSSGKAVSDMSSPRSQADPYLSPRSCKFAYQQHGKTGGENGKRGGHKHLAAIHSHVHRMLDSRDDAGGEGPASFLLDSQRHQPSPHHTGDRKAREKSGEKQATTSSELLKVLSRIRILEEQHNSSLNLSTALRAELEQANARVNELETEQMSSRREVEIIMKKMADEKASWIAKEQEKIKAAVQVVKEELEEERKGRRRIEMANRKMTKELVEANVTASKAQQEVEQERKARQLMEDVCDELAREIGDDKAEVEELKRESERVREELEEERRMLQMAEVWREERVQMKLGEAKLALEEKSAALDVMREELEAFLRTDKGDNPDATIEDALVLRNVITAIHPRGIVSSFPPAAATSPDNELYSVEPSHEEQMNRHEEQHGQYWGNPLDTQEVGSRWEDSEGDMEEENPEGRSPAYATSSHHVIRQSPQDWHAEEAKEGDSGSDFVSESDGDNLHENAEYERSHWDGHLEDEIHLQNGGAQDPEDDVDEYAHNDEDIVALSRQNGLHVQNGVWREEDHVNGVCTTTASALEEPHDMDRCTPSHAMSNGYGHLISESSPQQWMRTSPDAANSHITRGMKGHLEWPKSNVDVVTRAKLFEANLERQQLRHR